jgi:BirA family biotin operon repressor/biotin-[acetyl-CoA-carboxylase] ligase
MWSDGSSTAKAFRARRERRALRRAVRGAGVDAPVHYDEITESTNTAALDLASRGEPEWTVVVADHQTGGRGRLGRSWVSEPGAGLLCSFVLRPTLDPERGLLITLLAGFAMAEACGAVAGADVRCKWPNDLLLDGGKVGGVLTEARMRSGRFQHVVVGAGVNLTGAPPVDGAVALGRVDRAVLLGEFLRRFRERYYPQGEGFAHLVISSYAPLSATLGKRVRATVADGRVVEGTAIDLDPAGNLVVRTEDGPETVSFGEVLHLR